MQSGREGREQAGPLNGWGAVADYLERNQSKVKRWASYRDRPMSRPKGSSARQSYLDARYHRQTPTSCESGLPVRCFSGFKTWWRS